MNPRAYNESAISDAISEDLYLNRRTSIFGFITPTAIGLSFIPLFSVLIGHMLMRREKIYFVYFFLGGMVALLSNARYIIIGLIIISIQILLSGRYRVISFIKYLLLSLMTIFIFIKVLNYLDYDLNEWYAKRLFPERSIKETTRYKAIGNFLTFFPQNPIFGTGGTTEEIKEASRQVGSGHIHVGYLSSLVSYGIFGCLFLFGFWYFLAKELYRTAKITNYWGSFFAFLMFLWSFATMSMPSIFFYGLIFALIFDRYYYQQVHFKNMALIQSI